MPDGTQKYCICTQHSCVLLFVTVIYNIDVYINIVLISDSKNCCRQIFFFLRLDRIRLAGEEVVCK